MSKNYKKNNDSRGGLVVEVHNNDITKALRKFKKKVAEDGILQEVRKREYYESKGTKRRLDKAAATRRYKKNEQKRKLDLGY
jgi:ribosomal protein S21